jgi:hypothetical protein
MAVVAILMAGFTGVAVHRNAWFDNLARLAKKDSETIKQVVIDVEEVRAKLGRVPESQAELETHLGRKLPNVHDGVHPTPINYWRTSDDSYQLQYELWATDDWVFDSRNPEAGWVQHFF